MNAITQSAASGALERSKEIAYEAVFQKFTMPVFNDDNISPEAKNDIVAYLHAVDEQENVGGMSLGNLGPVSEGLFAWTFGLGLLVAFAVWLGRKAA